MSNPSFFMVMSFLCEFASDSTEKRKKDFSQVSAALGTFKSLSALLRIAKEDFWSWFASQCHLWPLSDLRVWTSQRSKCQPQHKVGRSSTEGTTHQVGHGVRPFRLPPASLWRCMVRTEEWYLWRYIQACWGDQSSKILSIILRRYIAMLQELSIMLRRDVFDGTVN